MKLKIFTIMFIISLSGFRCYEEFCDTLAPQSVLSHFKTYQGAKIIQLDKVKEVWVRREENSQAEYKIWNVFEFQFIGKSHQKLADFALSEYERYFGTTIDKRKPERIPGISAKELKTLFNEDKEKAEQLAGEYQDLENTATRLPPRVLLIPEETWNAMEPHIVTDEQGFTFGDSIGGINENTPQIINQQVQTAIRDDEYVLFNPGVLARIPIIIEGKRYYLFQLGIKNINHKGQIFYKPIGGHLGFTKKFIPIAQKWGIKDRSGNPIENEGDISLLIPKKHLEEFRQLYLSDILEKNFVYFEDPRHSMTREISEELGDDSIYDGIKLLAEEDYRSITFTNPLIVASKLQKLVKEYSSGSRYALDAIYDIISLVSSHKADRSQLEQLADLPTYIPGPYRVSAVYNFPEYPVILNFERSTLLETEADLLVRANIIRPGQKKELIEKTIALRDEILNIEVARDTRLEDTLTNFEHNLLVIQLFKLIIFGDPNTTQYTPHKYRNEKANQIALLLQEPGLPFKQQLLRTLRTFELLKYLSDEELLTKSAKQLAHELGSRLKDFDMTMLDIDASGMYEDVIINAKTPRKIAVVMDDNGEAVFLLRMIMEEMRQNPNLSFTIIPRGAQFRNDASFSDIKGIIDTEYFADMQRFMAQKRLIIVEDGPLLAGIDLSKLSYECAQELAEADYVLSIGETNFECLNGLKKDTFHIFAVYSSESSVVTGLPKESYVFTYIPSGVKYFDDFSKRDKRRLEYTDVMNQIDTQAKSIPVAGLTLQDVLPNIPQNRVGLVPESKLPLYLPAPLIQEKAVLYFQRSA